MTRKEQGAKVTAIADDGTSDNYLTIGQVVVGPLAMLILSLFAGIRFFAQGDRFGAGVFSLAVLAALFVLSLLVTPVVRARGKISQSRIDGPWA